MGDEMADLAHAQAAIESRIVSGEPVGLDVTVVNANLLIVVDRREFSRGCLTTWLTELGEEFEVVGVSDVRQLLGHDELTRARAVILSVGGSTAGDTWLEQQAEWLGEQGSDVPIVAILEPSDAARGDELVARLSLRGHIPTSSTLEIAKAALRLIFVGGSYSPRAPHEGVSLNCAAPGILEASLPIAPKLTSRENHVLELLMQGMANKIIAYRLGMSQSTVKVHVHNIIKKLNVRNRTEAAVTARNMRTTPPIARC
jgi:DNA-binding NarL/FixJ family response regulator